MDDLTTSSQLAGLRGLSFAGLNICSITRKIEDIHLLLDRGDLNCLCLNESWLNSSVTLEELSIENYTIHHMDRDGGSGKRGGGNIIFTKNTHKWSEMSNWSLCSPDIKYLWVKLELPDTRPTFLCSFYRPPLGSVSNFISILEQKLIDMPMD